MRPRPIHARDASTPLIMMMSTRDPVAGKSRRCSNRCHDERGDVRRAACAQRAASFVLDVQAASDMPHSRNVVRLRALDPRNTSSPHRGHDGCARRSERQHHARYRSSLVTPPASTRVSLALHAAKRGIGATTERRLRHARAASSARIMQRASCSARRSVSARATRRRRYTISRLHCATPNVARLRADTLAPGADVAFFAASEPGS